MASPRALDLPLALQSINDIPYLLLVKPCSIPDLSSGRPSLLFFMIPKTIPVAVASLPARTAILLGHTFFRAFGLPALLLTNNASFLAQSLFDPFGFTNQGFETF